MMFTVSSMIILALSTLVIVLANIRFDQKEKRITDSVHRMICICAFVMGCLFRLMYLGTLPGGVSAEEALVGMQAKALWQTGGFLFDGGLTTQFAQWTGESTGPLLATLTAPFVGLLGMTPWSVRLPLALLSCAAIPAAYALGCELQGKRLGRWMLLIYALCPYFVLSARLTCGANAAVCLLPAALWAMIKGFKKPAYAYAGAILMALLAYAQNMYFFISPAAIAAAACIGARGNAKWRHSIAAALLGLLVCIPAIMTLWINWNGAESFEWLGVVQIPALEGFDKADSLFDGLTASNVHWEIRSKVWAVLTGGVFQILDHMNISREMFAPTGMGALYVISLPLMMLGGFHLLHCVLSGRKSSKGFVTGRVFIVVVSVITLAALIVYGSVGALDLNGCTNVFDYSALLLFDAVLMAVGLCRMENKNSIASSVMSMLMGVCVVLLGVHLFGSGYKENANVYFSGFAEASVRAQEIQKETGAKIHVTGTVYPHITPTDAAEMMYLYAVNADTKDLSQRRGTQYDVIYAAGVEEPDVSQIYLVSTGDIAAWALEEFNYEEYGDYVLLSPLNQ